MEQISSWVKNLIFIILFTALLEMFLPESGMRKYVKIVIGFFVLSILILPISAVFRGEWSNIDPVLPGGLGLQEWEAIRTKGEAVEDSNRELIKGYYSQRIKDKVREVVELNFPDQTKEINLWINDDYQLSRLQIILSKGKDIERVEIEPIKIGAGEQAPEPGRGATKDQQTQDLQKRIGQLFLLPLNKIDIQYREGRE